LQVEVRLGKGKAIIVKKRVPMNAIEQLKGLREKVRQEMEAAMNAGRMDGVIKFARIIKEADDALQARAFP